jgi:serine O-acetyltransferase
MVISGLILCVFCRAEATKDGECRSHPSRATFGPPFGGPRSPLLSDTAAVDVMAGGYAYISLTKVLEISENSRIFAPAERRRAAAEASMATASLGLQPVTWAETRRRLRADRARLREMFRARSLDIPRLLLFHPSYQAIWLHRLSHFFFARDRRLLGRFFWHVNLLLTGVDVSPSSRIGAGVVLLHPICTQIFGVVGENCTFWGGGGIGGGRSSEDIGAGPGLPIVEDGVLFCTKAVVLGPVRIGAGSELGPGTLIYRDLPPGSRVEPSKPRVVLAVQSASTRPPSLGDGLGPSAGDPSARSHDEPV